MEIRLLGSPSVRVDDVERRLRGRKSWGLLAYLLLERRTVTRAHLMELLFSEADDPSRALRWNLTELRKGLGEHVIRTEGGVSITLPPGCRFDVDAIISLRWPAALGLDQIDRELLEGVTFPGCPSFEAWLLNERRHLRSCAAAVLREGALGRLAAGQTDAATNAAVRLVALDPLDEDAQALLIRCYAAAGDSTSAARQLAACTDLLRRELGVEPGAAVTQAIYTSPATVVRTPTGGRRAVSAQLEAGTAALRSGSIDAGTECLRRAAAEAHSLGDVSLSLDALLALGSALAHASRPRHQEGAAALHAALNAARRIDRPLSAAQAQIELAWIEYMWARYERAQLWLEGALADAHDDGAIRSMALWVRGKCAVETGNYAASISDLEAAVEVADAIEDPARRAFCLASLGRTYLFMRSLEKARPVLNRALEIGRSHGFLWTTPLPETFLGEVEILAGNLDVAEELLEHAYASAREIGDPSFLTLSLRGLGLLHSASGREDDALRLLHEARSLCLTTPDCEWAFAYALDALAEFGASRRIDQAAQWVMELEAVAGRNGMKEMVSHAYVFKHRLGVDDALDTARSLAVEVDNPALHRMLETTDQVA